ncbi:MAG: hypothetical protein ACPHK8_02380 [Thermoplasmatota archaeon]
MSIKEPPKRWWIGIPMLLPIPEAAAVAISFLDNPITGFMLMLMLPIWLPVSLLGAAFLTSRIHGGKDAKTVFTQVGVVVMGLLAFALHWLLAFLIWLAIIPNQPFT